MVPEKKGRGIEGRPITKTISALLYVDGLLRSHIAAETYAMYSHRSARILAHIEDTKSQQSRDTDDETSLVTAFKGLQVFVSVTPSP